MSAVPGQYIKRHYVYKYSSTFELNGSAIIITDALIIVNFGLFLFKLKVNANIFA